MDNLKYLESVVGRKFSAGECLAMKVIPMREKGVMRVVSGVLLSALSLSYETGTLAQIKIELEHALHDLSARDFGEYEKLNVAVHEGASHLDVISAGNGSLNWLTVADHNHHVWGE